MLVSLLFAAIAASSSLATPVKRADVSPVDSFYQFKRAATISSGCSTTGAASCSSSIPSNLCCFESPGGLLLQTQFWDYSPSTGPTDSWTIHGLWPDHCDLTFDQNCDSSRVYTGIAALLTANGAADTLSYMQTYWKDINGNDETFWEHEWSTHGTCMSTLKTACISGYTKGIEAVAFFNTVVKVFKSVPTYQWLAAAGITPSATAKYTLAQITAALKSASGGFTPALDCTSSNLNAISWYFHLQGSIIDGTFVHITAPEAGSCPSTGIGYVPKSGSGGGGGGGSDGTLPAKATLKAIGVTGVILSLGTLSTQTGGTMTLTGSASSFTMVSSKGSCGVNGGLFSCGSGVSSTFTAVLSGTTLLLAFGGSTAFTSDTAPSGSTVSSVFTGSGRAIDYTISFVTV